MLAGLDAIGGFVGTTSTSGGTGGSLAVALSTNSISKTGGARSGPKTLTTTPVTATPSGGAGGYTHAWTLVSGSGITITSPTAATTTFSATLNLNDSVEATFHDTVTDSAGAVVVSEIVSVDIALIDTSSPL